MREMADDVREKADLLFRELIEPTDLYIKHYSATNTILMEQATDIWQGLHKSRTNMLMSKENYFGILTQLQKLQANPTTKYKNQRSSSFGGNAPSSMLTMNSAPS